MGKQYGMENDGKIESFCEKESYLCECIFHDADFSVCFCLCVLEGMELNFFVIVTGLIVAHLNCNNTVILIVSR